MVVRCPDEQDLDRFVRGDTSAIEAIEFRAHLEACATCRTRVEDAALLDDVKRVLASDLAPALEPVTGMTVAGFRLIERIGAGGMGVVWRAEQARPRRTVALKLIRPTAATDANLRRFELEADAIGRLQHPGIAQVHAAGVFSHEGESHPYLALELVEGRSVTDHCRDGALSIADRVELVAQIADAVHHAHENGVIHRDLKPSNVLVDGDGRPRILDFGVAKLVETDGARSETHTGQVVGTMEYMSPEQLDGAAVDARSDVFALGAIAYEVIGAAPRHELDGLALPEILRRLREDSPKPLGARDRRLGGDLELVVHTALAVDRAQRYDSAAAFARDLRRVLASEPVAARPPSVIYQLGKLARRHRLLAVSSLLVIVAVVVAAAISAVFAVKASRAAADEARERGHVEQVIGLLQEMLVAADPHGPGSNPGLDLPLARAAATLDWDALEPPVALRVRAMLGHVFSITGRFEEAIEHLSEAQRLRDELGDLGSLDRANELNALAIAYSNLERYDMAEQAFAQSLDFSRAGDVPPGDVAMIAFNLATQQRRRGEFADAIGMIHEARAIWLDEYGPDHAYVLGCDIAIAKNELGGGRVAEAADLLEDLSARLEPKDDPQSRMSRARCLIFLAEARSEMGDTDAVDRAVDEVLLLAERRAVGSGDRTGYHAHAARLIAGHRRADAIEILRAEYDRVVAAFGEDHQAAVDLADGLRELGGE